MAAWEEAKDEFMPLFMGLDWRGSNPLGKGVVARYLCANPTGKAGSSIL